MKGFKTYSGYKVGASHIAKNMGCEDYAAAYDNEKVSIAAISDGHGDKKCFRSSQGANIACDTAIDCVRRLFESSPDACNALKESPDRIITELERTIIREWHKGVEKDLNNRPITDNELEGLPEDAVEAIRSGHSLNKIYGCTLIIGAVTEGFWFGIHIGDGKCVAALKNGCYIQPIPWDETGCVGNRSTSICNSNAFAGFRYIYGTDVPTGLFVVSDGVDESFDESGLNRCCYTLGYWVQTMQREELDEKMEELLSQIASKGSGDDVSIACILSETDAIRKPYASSEQVAGKLKELINSIKDKEDQFDSLTESKKEAADSIDKLRSEIEDLKKKIALREEQIIDKEQELTSIDKNRQYVIAELQKSVEQLPKAKDTKERIDQYWKANGVNIKEDTELNYSPRYSAEYLGKVMSEIEGSYKEEKILEETKGETREAIKEETEKIKEDKPVQKNEVLNTKDPAFERRSSAVEAEKRGISSVAEKNGFFGGLFRRK